MKTRFREASSHCRLPDLLRLLPQKVTTEQPLDLKTLAAAGK